MHTYLIKNARIVNEGSQFYGEVLIKNGRIEKIASQIDVRENCIEIDANGKILMPGIIDDQVHFSQSRHCGRCYHVYGNAKHQSACNDARPIATEI